MDPGPTASASLARNVLEMQILRPQTRPTEPESLEVSPQPVFEQTPQGFLMLTKAQEPH